MLRKDHLYVVEGKLRTDAALTMDAAVAVAKVAGLPARVTEWSRTVAVEIDYSLNNLCGWVRESRWVILDHG